jgi:hypothetical protein
MTAQSTAIVAAISETEERLRALLPRARARPMTRLTEGTWTVRDALCHLAARASAAAESEAINAGQIASRDGHSVDELADEAVAGYAAARADVLKLDAAQLSQTIPNVPGQGPMGVADLLLVVYRHHARAHLDSIEQALTQSRE